MQTKNLLVYNYNATWAIKIIRKINLVKILFLLILLGVSFVGIMRFSEVIGHAGKDGDTLVADFKTDINMLSETAAVLEIERASGKNSEINKFGSDGNLLSVNEISRDLQAALVKMEDIYGDAKLSKEEISDLGIMRLNSDLFKKELRNNKFNLISVDQNLKKYIVITKGKYAGTVLYNGNIKYIDNEEKQYFGLELFK